MTRRFWHQISVRIGPYVGRLVTAFAISLSLSVATFAGVIELYPTGYDKWAFFLVWCCFIATFWCFGLLFIWIQYRKLPQPSTSSLGRLVYSAKVVMGSIGAVFFTLWFGILALMTIVGPVIILMSDASNR